MKWILVIQQKLKVAVLLAAVMSLVVIFNLMLQRNISQINQTVNSIYNDRLIPATDIFYFSENLHKRQMAMELFLSRDNFTPEKLMTELSQRDMEMVQLISKIEKTYLVDQESLFLKQLKSSLSAYSDLEKRIIHLLDEGKTAEAKLLYEDYGRVAIQNTTSKLIMLTSIQSEVGSELIRDTDSTVKISNVLVDLQLILSIIIGSIIIALVISSKMISRVQGSFRWN